MGSNERRNGTMKKSTPIRLIKPNLGESEFEAVRAVLQSGMLVAGPHVDEFEKRLAEYLEIEFAVLVSSGTAALHLSLLAMDIGPGDEVLVSALTFPATANAVELVGATPVFVDCGPNSVNLDSNLVESRIGPKTKAILPVHAFGLPADMGRLAQIADQHNLSVLEDAACALGTKLHNQWCGAMGQAGVFSFHPRKLLTTGEGGAVVTENADIARRVRELRNHGFMDGSYRSVGFNYRMTDFQAAMGTVQLGGYGNALAQRRILAEQYWKRLRSISWAQPIVPDDSVEWNVQTLLVCLDTGIDPKQVIGHLKRYDIESTIGTYCVPQLPYYRKRYERAEESFPNAGHQFNHLLSLPLYTGMTIDDIERVVFALDSFFSN